MKPQPDESHPHPKTVPLVSPHLHLNHPFCLIVFRVSDENFVRISHLFYVYYVPC